MCLIIVKPVNVKLPKDQYLYNAETNNKDGIGIAYWKHGTREVKIKKDFIGTKEFIEWERENLSPLDSFVLHFRLATSGVVDMGNRHPFAITRDIDKVRAISTACDMAVAHNGILTGYSGHKVLSDTIKFVIDILAEPVIKDSIFQSQAVQKLVNEYIDGDKLAIINDKGKIILLGEFEKAKHLFFSNTGYKYTYYPSSFPSDWTTKDIDRSIKYRDYCDNCAQPAETTSVLYDSVYMNLCSECLGVYAKRIKLECYNCGKELPYGEAVFNASEPYCKFCTSYIDEPGDY